MNRRFPLHQEVQEADKREIIRSAQVEDKGHTINKYLINVLSQPSRTWRYNIEMDDALINSP